MRILIVLLVIAAAFLAIGPALWLGMFTYAAIGHFSIYGVFDYWSGGALIVAAACWWGYATAYWFCRRSFITHAISHMRSPWVIGGLLVGVAGAVIAELIALPSPVVDIPWGFFLWPIASIIGVGLLGPMWPNPALNTDAGPAAGAG